ncbi:MAG: gliding motility-associated C-terminal domain-containing protein [Saprospiraceae bacterium]|nr:gliding motility-associated C-terminal domain-containing protein [Saprospiraceae bacterium]
MMPHTLQPRKIGKLIVMIAVFSLPLHLYALDYFWIGGSGNWSDLSHWVTTSGGTVQHDQIPTAADNVIFDENSFSAAANEIMLNLDFIFCRDIDFRAISQAVTLRGESSTTFSIHGSLFMHSDVMLDFEGAFDFKSDIVGNELHWFGQEPVRINFLGNGSWTLATDLVVDSLIHVEFGNLIFGPVEVICQRFEVFSKTRVGLDFGMSTLIITGNRTRALPSYRWRESLHFDGGQIDINPGTSTIQLNGVRSSIGFYEIDAIHLGSIELGVAGGDHLIYTTWSGNFEFDRLHLRGNTYLQGAFNMHELMLEGTNVYTFQSNFEQRIGTLSATADCGATAFIKASEGGQTAIFRATSGTQTVDFMMIQDIQVAGATYQATNAIDLGGNSGWTIQKKVTDTFYWIGGTGNWDDTGHWSFSSGGPPSGCLPTAADDVIFDQNSFSAANQQVIVNIQNAFCHSFDWRLVDRACQLTNLMLSNKSSIHVFGSLWFSPLMQNDFQGDFLFESPHMGNEILSAGKEFNLNIHFNSALGEWTLSDEIVVSDTILFNAGILRSNDQDITCFHLMSESGAFRELYLGTSLVRLVMTDLRPYYWSRISFNATNLKIFPGTSLIRCENSTTFNSFAPGRVDIYEIIFEGFGGMTNDYGTETELNIAKATFFVDGDFRNQFNIDTLIFSPGWKYTMFMNTVLYIDSLSAHGDCDGSIYFGSYPKGIQTSVIKQTGSVVTSELILEGIRGEGGATYQAQASVDLGQNTGWNFTEKQPRTLYWVGNEGLWHDRQNWSLASGGLGGECIPTAIDDVIFDENSFDAMWLRVGLKGSRSAICHTMTWQNVPDFVRIDDGDLFLTGSLVLEENVDFQPWNLLFSSDSLENTITTSGNPISWVEFMGKGCWSLLDDLNAVYQLHLRQGTLKTMGKMVTTGRILMDNYPVDFERKLILDDSYVLLTPMPTSDDQLFISSRKVTIDAGTSTVEFTGSDARSRMYGSDTLTLNNVLFSNIAGTSTIEQWDESHFEYSRLQFNNNAIIYGNNKMDSLFLAPGKAYQLESGKTQEVSGYMYAIGNNCIPISIRSTEPGQQSRTFSQSARIVADFVQLQDQNAFGGADFTAGSHSTDIANNSGWKFDPAPDHIDVGFLGTDRTLCQDSALTLSAFNFSPGETYLWDNGLTDSIRPVSIGGIYSAQVTFNNNCVIRDTIKILDPLSINVDIGTDTSLCEGEVLELDGDIDFPETQYQWQDGTQGARLIVSEAGLYSIAAEVDGCFFSDSISVSYKPLPETSIQGASSACEGEMLTLDASSAGGNYRWQDNSTQPFLSVNSDGLYWVEVELDQCIAADTVEIVFTPRPPLDLGLDTVLCEDEVLNLDVSLQNSTYQWQDGTASGNYRIQTAGLYWVEMTRQSCSVRDSIEVIYQAKPMLPEISDTSLCEGTQWDLELDEPNVEYVWSTGDLAGSITIDQPGLYSLNARLNGCSRDAEFRVNFVPPPSIDLGSDQILCEGEAFEYAFGEPDVSYIWQDGHNSGNYSITEPGIYSVIAQKFNCNASDSVAILFNPLPAFSLGPDLHLCPGASFAIQPDIDSGTRRWSDGSSGIMFTGNEPGTYWLTIEQNDCEFTDSVIVSNSDPLAIDLGVDTVVCADKGLLINAFDPRAVEYRWQDGTREAEKLVQVPGIYHIEVSDGQCLFEDEIVVDFRECHYFSIYVPNAFTPDGDGNNDEFLPLITPNIQVENYRFRVFSRWGNLLFSSQDLNESWDGTFSGQSLSPDAYLYSLQFDYTDDEGSGRYEHGGSVTIIK